MKDKHNKEWIKEQLARFVAGELSDEELDYALAFFHEKRKEIEENERLLIRQIKVPKS